MICTFILVQTSSKKERYEVFSPGNVRLLDVTPENKMLFSQAQELLDNDPSMFEQHNTVPSESVLNDRQLTKKLIEHQGTIIGIIIYKKQKGNFKLERLSFDQEAIKKESCYILTKVLVQTRCYNKSDQSVSGNLESVQYWKKKFLK